MKEPEVTEGGYLFVRVESSKSIGGKLYPMSVIDHISRIQLGPNQFVDCVSKKLRSRKLGDEMCWDEFERPCTLSKALIRVYPEPAEPPAPAVKKRVRKVKKTAEP